MGASKGIYEAAAEAAAADLDDALRDSVSRIEEVVLQDFALLLSYVKLRPSMVFARGRTHRAMSTIVETRREEVLAYERSGA